MKTKSAATVIALLGLLLVPCAQATYDPIGSGTTKLILDKGFISQMRKQGVKVVANAPAKLKAGTITLPVSGGSLDPTLSKGEIEAEGSIVFTSGNRKVPLRSIEAKTKKTPLYAKVGGGQLKVASAKSLSFKREGFNSSFGAKGLALTQKVATRLNKKLRTKDFFNEGQLIGTLKSTTQPQLVSILPQGQATLVPDPAFLAKLKSLFVSLNPISPAELSPGPVLHFPIAGGGQLAPNGSEGTLRTAGAIELLQLGAGQVFQREYWFDLGAKSTAAEVDVEPTPAFPGKLGQIGVFGIDMTRASVSSEPKSRTISVAGAPLTLNAQTAQTFNEAFGGGKAVFGAGEAFGAVSFGAVGQ
ncbi:MAG TPA: hypothetical protein VN758_13245 [Solirubrobacterales bacterium]|nr:hypothetical protein [Solirubrobacterales bacterium]